MGNVFSVLPYRPEGGNWVWEAFVNAGLHDVRATSQSRSESAEFIRKNYELAGTFNNVEEATKFLEREYASLVIEDALVDLEE